MCPAAGLSPLRVGPEDPTVAEAGDLVKKIGVGNQAKDLIIAVSKQMPKALRIAAQRYEHVERSEYLAEHEVLAQTEHTVGEENVTAILSARVRGNKTKPLDSQVVVLFETPEGRTARCAIDYAVFPDSQDAFDRALKAGEVEVGADNESAAGLRRQVERLKAELETTRDEPLAKAAEETPPGEPPEQPVAIEEVELPDGVEAGDPGYPVDPESGKLILLPDEVREQLIEAAEESEGLREELEKAKAVPADAEEPPPVDLSEVELPKGNAKEIEAMLPFLEPTVVAALAEYGNAKSTREAAAALVPPAAEG